MIKANRWQVQWISRDGVTRTRMFKVRENAKKFAEKVDHAPWSTPEIWEMSA